MNLINVFQEIAAHFVSPKYQKTAQNISRIDLEKGKIYVEDWKYEWWFTVYLYRSTWPITIECFKKEFFPWELVDYCKAAGYETGNDFDSWWNGNLMATQRIIVEDFVRIHDRTLQQELDQYFLKVGITKNTGC